MNFSIKNSQLAAKVEEAFPRRYRLAQCHNGQIKLQGEFFWYNESGRGSEWKDMPAVVLDEKGVVVQ